MLSKNKSGKTICIIGTNVLQNQLFKEYIEQQISFSCYFREKFLGSDTPALFLLDCYNLPVDVLWQELSYRGISTNQHRIALFNVDPEHDVASEAATGGIRGIFFTNTPLDQILKGLKVIMSGELWFSRKILAKTLQSEEHPTHVLTNREREILLNIANGESNKDIASMLGISQHTVKTHIYNIYRKINVSRRFKAAQWASRNLDV